MAKIKINNLNRENQMVELDDKQLLNLLGGKATTWHVYHGRNGRVIDSYWDADGKDTVVHHYP